MMAESAEKTEWKLDPHRWVQLGLLALLALISDWVCFATTANPGEWLSIQGHEASELIDIFLCANVASCFLYTDVAARFGLRKVMIFAASLMAAGEPPAAGPSPAPPSPTSARPHPAPLVAQAAS